MAKPDTPSKISVNLDTLEREGDPGPFVIVLGGKRYELLDAMDLDFRDLLASQRAAMLGEPEKALELIIATGDRVEFFGNRLPNWKLETLFKSYNAHFGLPTPGEAPASPRP